MTQTNESYVPEQARARPLITQGMLAGSGFGGGTVCPPVEEATAWQRGCEGIWRPVDFDGPSCLEVSDTPRLAAPPIEWEACWWGEGCHYMKKNWPTRPGYWRESSEPTVIPWGDGYRVAILQLWYPDPAGTLNYMRSIVYDETGLPMLAWRGTEGGCGPGIPQLTPHHVWLSTLTYPQMMMAFGSYDEIAHVSKAALIERGFQAIDGKDELFSSWAANGRTSSVYDRITNKTYNYGVGRDDISTTLPRIAGNGAFFRCSEGIIDPGACAWDRGTGAFTMLIPPTTTQVIPGVTSDGERLIWFVATKPMKSDYSWTKVEIWSSPFATTPAALQPTKIADSPPVGFPQPLINWHLPARTGEYTFIDFLICVIGRLVRRLKR